MLIYAPSILTLSDLFRSQDHHLEIKKKTVLEVFPNFVRRKIHKLTSFQLVCDFFILYHACER